MTNIVDWFNPRNIEHIKAYDHLRKNGTWPVGFINAGTEFPPTWLLGISEKISNVYVTDALLLDRRGFLDK